MQKVLWIALAGALGTVSRYALGSMVQRIAGGSLPWGTWAVNIVGCFLFGLVVSLADKRFMLTPEARLIILTGFMGAFTTFSTFIFESGGMLSEAQWLPMIGNMAGQIIIGMGFLFIGLGLGLAV